MTGRATRLLLVGGGHAHSEVLRQFAHAPEPELVYSGLLPGVAPNGARHPVVGLSSHGPRLVYHCPMPTKRIRRPRATAR